MFPERKENEQNFTITKDGVEYKLPVHWSLTDSGSYTFRSKLQSRAFAHGGRLTAGPFRWNFPWRELPKKIMTKC
ncbi:hypothetical protein [uncultured Acidaminococcus sp.]|uniref:hypothetical protein n=1 Tax=uncultured Acidaminococcus sp. TaxID=352152 RepID=UPI00258B6DD3|nr:hypothetical protein [uncultured Acidaminococcus sp.]